MPEGYTAMHVAYPSGRVIIVHVPDDEFASLRQSGQLPLRPISDDEIEAQQEGE